jgi:hypothetical protein
LNRYEHRREFYRKVFREDGSEGVRDLNDNIQDPVDEETLSGWIDDWLTGNDAVRFAGGKP